MGHSITATVFGNEVSESVLVINSATGVKQLFYAKFSEFIASHQVTVITYDYHGIFQSLNQDIAQIKNNAADWARNDMEAILRYAKKHYPNAKLTLMGHSIGGQMIGLARTAVCADKIILITAQNGYWGYWKGMGKVRMFFNWYLLFPVLTNLFGYMPSKKIMGMENLPKKVAQQWCKWCRHPFYLFGDKTIENKYYDEITAPLTAISVSDDRFAPKDTVDWMAQKFTKAKPKRIHWSPVDFNVVEIGHFGLFRSTFSENIWPLLLDEVEVDS